jgi:hypothetical protein
MHAIKRPLGDPEDPADFPLLDGALHCLFLFFFRFFLVVVLLRHAVRLWREKKRGGTVEVYHVG